jgi:pyridoxine/pyridoxamine 5'-phosphate oxidase
MPDPIKDAALEVAAVEFEIIAEMAPTERARRYYESRAWDMRFALNVSDQSPEVPSDGCDHAPGG